MLVKKRWRKELRVPVWGRSALPTNFYFWISDLFWENLEFGGWFDGSGLVLSDVLGVYFVFLNTKYRTVILTCFYGKYLDKAVVYDEGKSNRIIIALNIWVYLRFLIYQLCVCICMCLCECICLHVCVCMSVSVFMSDVCVCTVRVSVCLCLIVCMSVWLYVCMFVCVWLFLSVCVF